MTLNTSLFAFILRYLLLELVKTVPVQPDLIEIHHSLPASCDRNIRSSELMRIANSTALNSKAPTLPHPFGPSLRLGIVTYATNNIWDYASFAMAINAAYAEQNGYSLTILDESSGPMEDSDSRWNKVTILERALHPVDGWAQDMDYLVWIDADFAFLDFSFRLESVISQAHNLKAHIFVSAGMYYVL